MNSMARATTMVLAAVLAVLLLAASSASAARPDPAPATTTSMVATAEAVPSKASPNEKGAVAAGDDLECEGEAAGEEEECMARRTLAAHTDYIYTQEHHN